MSPEARSPEARSSKARSYEMRSPALCRRFLAGSLIGLFIFTGCVNAAADQPANVDISNTSDTDAAADAPESADAARAVIDSLHNTLFAVANESALSYDQRFDQLAPVVDASYDFAYIGRFILRRAWADFDEVQREKFISAFRRLSVANYASRFAEIDDQALVVTGVRPATGQRMQVDARLQLDDRDITLSYTLNAGSDDSERWTIVNVIADGVSDLALRRAEYSRVLKKKGFDGLLDHIDGQIANL